MSYAKVARVALGLVALSSAIAGAWWVVGASALLLSLRFRAWEVPLVGLLMDFLWLPGPLLAHIPTFTLASLAVVWLFEPMRSQFLIAD